jgi:hypothetical protein
MPSRSRFENQNQLKQNASDKVLITTKYASAIPLVARFGNMAEDDDLVDDFLAAAGLGGPASRDASPIQSSAAPKSAPKKRKNASKASIAKTKRRKRSYCDPPTFLTCSDRTQSQKCPRSLKMNLKTLP